MPVQRPGDKLTMHRTELESELVRHAIDRVWTVIAHTDTVSSEEQARGLIARCVQREVAKGETDLAVVANKSLNEFRRRQKRSPPLFSAPRKV